MPVQQPANSPGILTVGDLDRSALPTLAARYGLEFVEVPADADIPGTFWGEPEAGIIGCAVYARPDTPVHSVLHELSHIVCMTPARRAGLERDAGGDDDEECAVCYLQIVLADSLAGVGAARLMRDMDGWGYSFRLGSTRRWFEADAADARRWLEAAGILAADGSVTGRLRDSGQDNAAGTADRLAKRAPGGL